MLKKENRLTKNKEFDKIWKNGRSSFDKILGVKAIKNDLGVNRFGILVGLKVSKKAVLRNKIKRKIREIIKANLENLNKSFDITLVTLPLIKDKTSQEIEKSVNFNLKRLNILK